MHETSTELLVNRR